MLDSKEARDNFRQHFQLLEGCSQNSDFAELNEVMETTVNKENGKWLIYPAAFFSKELLPRLLQR